MNVVVVDTNVLVAGLLTQDTKAPTVRLLDAMLTGRLCPLLSAALLDEYRGVLLRPRLKKRHGLETTDIDALLTELVQSAIMAEPEAAGPSPDPGDQHLWDLLAAQPGAVLVTGDQRLLDNPPSNANVITSRECVDELLK